MNTRKIFIIVLVVLFVLGVLYLIFLNNKKASTPPLIVSSNPSWNKITPGTSSESDVISELGQPKSKTLDTLFYNSKSLTRDNQITVTNGVVGLIKEEVAFIEKRKIEEITSKYGVPDTTLYGPGAVNGQYLFVYPQKGVAFVGNPITNNLTEVWYFQPTTLDLFLQKYAQDYSTTQKTGVF